MNKWKIISNEQILWEKMSFFYDVINCDLNNRKLLKIIQIPLYKFFLMSLRLFIPKMVYLGLVLTPQNIVTSCDVIRDVTGVTDGSNGQHAQHILETSF